MQGSETLLEVKDLKTYFYTDEGVIKAVDGVSFEVGKGRTLGIVGESGCGKSITSFSIMQLIESPPGKIVGGNINYGGIDLLKSSKEEMRNIRGNEISMIFQEPMTSLNPVMTIGKQIMETLLIHKNVSKKEAKDTAIKMLKLVRIPDPEKRFNEYPHQLSGGMRQRIVIAIALACNPKLLICDEPTTALDVTIQAQILDLINNLKKTAGASVIMITHDLGVIAEIADDIIVMYAGKIVESGSADDIFANPMHPYTKGLMECIPKLNKDVDELNVIPGMVPSIGNMPKGCSFCPRCKYADDICKEEMPELVEIKGQKVRCFKYSELWEVV